MKFYALKYKQLDLGLLRSSLEELDKTNRDILEDFEIHSYCKPLGRPPKDPPSDEMKSRMAKSHRGSQRNRMLIRYMQENLSSQ